MSASKPQIVFSKKGPYVVRQVEQLVDEQGNSLEARRVMALCRCGQSGSMPYCDGRHTESGFNNTITDQKKRKIYRYDGQEITIYFDYDICAHVAICLEKLPSVFSLKRKPWVDPDGADVQAIIETIEACPSGALQYSLAHPDVTGAMTEPANVHHGCSGACSCGTKAKRIIVTQDGPYYVEGGIELTGAEQTPPDIQRYCLCSCGKTENTPFCDGNHLDKKIF